MIRAGERWGGGLGVRRRSVELGLAMMVGRGLALVGAVLLALVPLMARGALESTRLDWGIPAQMPTLRSELGLAAAPNGKLYAVGGTSNFNAAIATVEEYDPATNTWATKRPMPTARRDSPGLATAPNGKLYAVGGA